MQPKGDESIRKLYANLMEEVKLRIDCIDRAVKGQMGFPGPIVREFCYIQLRLLCELISLSCLVAHGDIPATYSKQLGKQYSADAIMRELEKLRTHFYPIPVKQTTTRLDGTHKQHNLAAINQSPLSKESLLELYADTHKHLHRGNVRKLLNSATPIEEQTNFPEIIKWAQRINDLLNHHFIAISEHKLIVCMLRNAENNNKSQVVSAERRSIQ